MLNYNRFINTLSAKRKPSVIRELTKILSSASPDMIPLSAGMPNPNLFPFTKVDITVNNGGENSIKIENSKLKGALQYQPTNGYPPLVQQIKELQFQIHNPPKKTWENSDVLMVAGSQDGLCKSLEMLLNPNAQSTVICEDFIYSGTLAIMDPYEPKYMIIPGDGHGMIPQKLEKSLQDRNDQILPEPKFVYINPTGANPTGTVLPENRRKEIYEICCKHNLLILEDDPYYYLQFGNDERQVPSFFSMDVEGRVLRFDSFSKILSSGIRLGFVTGPKPLTERIGLHMQASVLHASSLSQVITSELLKNWEIEGFLNHVKKIQEFYIKRRDLMNKAALKHLTGLCEWNIPQGGMFLWIKVDGVNNTWDMIMKRGLEKNIMLLPGKAFMPQNRGEETSSSYLRAAYSLADEDKFDVAFERLAQLIKEEKST